MANNIDEQYRSQSHKLELFREHFRPELPGDFAEFGVYHGQGIRDLASLDPSRLAWAFDTFEGMPEADYGGDEDKSDPPGKWKPDAPPEVLFAGVPNIQVMKGRFADTLPLVPADVRFVLCHIDCDWYASHRQVLEWLEGRLTPGAALLFDDPGLPGAKRAIEEWVGQVGRAVQYDGGAKAVWLGLPQ